MMSGQHNPGQMHKMMEQHLREQLGATEEEWKTLGPHVMKVSDLHQATPNGGMMGGCMMGSPQDAQAKQQTPVETAREQLRAILDNTSATPDQIETQLTALSKVKETAKEPLTTAQNDLRKIITTRQKAQLVLLNILD
jgi:hypothetical protein